MRKLILCLLVVLLAFPTVLTTTAQSPGNAPTPEEINAQLAAMGVNLQIASIHYFTIGEGRPADRILQQQFRWVAGDPNRLAQGNDLTYMIVPDGTASGVSAADTTAAIRSAMNTWNNEQCLRKVSLVERAYTGEDVTIYDSFFGFGGFGNYVAADIVNAGWYPPEFFAAAGASPTGTLAFSVTFTWVDDSGAPADFNNDGYVDTALNEVYYNDAFGGVLRPGNPWAINQILPAIDVETVALHENGHSLGVGHFGPAPVAVMNPVYGGINHEPDATDAAAMCTLFNRWPN